jgi:hypothetical protein
MNEDPRHPNDRTRIVSVLLMGFMIVLVSFVVGAVVVVRSIVQDVNTIETFSDRADCARAIGAEQSAVLRHRDALQATVVLTVAKVLVVTAEERPALITNLGTFTEALDKAEVAVEALEPLDEAVKHRCPAVEAT